KRGSTTTRGRVVSRQSRPVQEKPGALATRRRRRAQSCVAQYCQITRFRRPNMVEAAMHWRLKGAIQAILRTVPRGPELHHLLQRRVGGLKNFESELRTKIDDGLLMLNHLREVSMPVTGSRFMEIGSGWYPTLPLLLHFGGAKSVH